MARSEERAPHGQYGFCPGLFWLPGVLAVLGVHLIVLDLGVRFFRASGWSAVPLLVAAAVLLAFWALFAIAGYFIGARAVANLLGLAFVILFWIGLLGGSLVLLVWWAARL